MGKKKTKDPAPFVYNSVQISLGDHEPASIVVNGVEIAGMIEPNTRLDFSEDEAGVREARLTVTYPVPLA